MKPETKARLVVSLLVSLAAFTLASGVGAFLGLGNATTNLPDLNLTPQGDLPSIWNTDNTTTKVQTNTTAPAPQKPQEDVYQEVVTPPGNGDNNGDDNSPVNRTNR